MKLYFFPVAPNPTRVRLYLAEKKAAGAEVELEEVLVNLREGEQKTPEHLARHPLGKLPVLELDDGSLICESLAIIEYLEEVSPEFPMIGSDPQGRARVREAERLAEIGVSIPVALAVHTTRSPLGWPPNPGAAQFFRERLPDTLRLLDERLSDGRPFVTGDRVTTADCTLAAAFQFGRFGQLDLDLENSFSHLARWDREFRARPSAASVLVL